MSIHCTHSLSKWASETEDLSEAGAAVNIRDALRAARNAVVQRAEPGQWQLKGLVKCGVCGVGTNAHRLRGRNGSWHRYYYCRKHDTIRAGGADRRCPERNIRAEALDTYVFDQIRNALLHPGTLLAGERAVTARTPMPDDELLAAELARPDRKITSADDERRRLATSTRPGCSDFPTCTSQPPITNTDAKNSPTAAKISPPTGENSSATTRSATASKDSPDESPP